MVHILGLSAFYHDSAAALVRDGEIVAAAQEERFSRKKHDARFPRNAVAVLPPRGRDQDQGRRLRRLLRQAVPQVRADPRDVSRRRPVGLPELPQGHAGLAQGEAQRLGDDHRRRSSAATARADPLRRAPRVARGVGVLSLALGKGRDPHDRRRRRVGDDDVRPRRREQARDPGRDPLPPLARVCSIRLSPTTRASRSTRASTRSWAWRPTAIRRLQGTEADPRQRLRPPRRRQLPARPELFRLPLGVEHDLGQVRRADRWTAAQARSQAHAARRWTSRSRCKRSPS